MVCLNPLATERQKIWARPRLEACAAHAAAFPSSLQVLKIMAVTELETADRPGMVTRLGHVVLYGLALVLVLLAPILGMLVAAVAAWHAVLAQSIILLPLGLFLVLVILSVYQRHGRSDLAVLSLMLAATASWFLLDSQARIEMLKWGGCASASGGAVGRRAGSHGAAACAAICVPFFRAAKTPPCSGAENSRLASNPKQGTHRRGIRLSQGVSGSFEAAASFATRRDGHSATGSE